MLIDLRFLKLILSSASFRQTAGVNAKGTFYVLIRLVFSRIYQLSAHPHKMILLYDPGTLFLRPGAFLNSIHQQDRRVVWVFTGILHLGLEEKNNFVSLHAENLFFLSGGQSFAVACL